ncbi:MAG: 30S ribosomal protein S27ae [Candidatus Helarchaeota archaeon]|nr:30S ribosomal protein S27ae [Candidatus Helarchaeota archaeon]
MSKGVGKFYKISEDGKTIKRTRKFCPRCGPGTFMAEMYDRIVCGHCGFTEFKKKPPKKVKEQPKDTEKKAKRKAKPAKTTAKPKKKSIK